MPRFKKLSALNWQVQRRMGARLDLALSGGGWWCNDCQQHTEREEGEQGQPSHCIHCGSHRIEYQPPID